MSSHENITCHEPTLLELGVPPADISRSLTSYNVNRIFFLIRGNPDAQGKEKHQVFKLQ